MESKTKRSALKTFCLHIRLKRLEAQRMQEIEKFIARNPVQAAKMDNIEKKFQSELFQEIDFKIRAIQRLLDQPSKN